MPTLRTRRLGVSLIEALVALAVMAFGMLSLVGVQATLRLNSDLAKQRTEATRIATEDIEGLRLFTAVNPVNGQVSWAEIDNSTVASYVPPGNVGNTSYRVERTVFPRRPVPPATLLAGTINKSVSVTVRWTDRTGTAQSVTVDTVIARIDPVLSGVLSSRRSSINNQVGGRDATIPVEAVSFGDPDGRSAFKPSTSGTVVWLFNNVSGEILTRCVGIATAQISISAATIAAAQARGDCATLSTPGVFVAGDVLFDLNPSPSGLRLDASYGAGGVTLPLSLMSPLSFPNTNLSRVGQSQAAECFSNANELLQSATSILANSMTPGRTGFYLPYTCLVYPSTSSGWGGKLDVDLALTYQLGEALPNGSKPSDYKVCRFTKAQSDETDNPDHPRVYCVAKPLPAPTDLKPCNGQRVKKSLQDQSFLVIAANQTCPPNTRQHQP